MDYKKQISELNDISFDKIRKISTECLDSYPEEYRNRLWDELARGTAVLQTEDHLCQYLYSYGAMHQEKIKRSLVNFSYDELIKNDFEIIDWGCGQGLATVCFLDELKRNPETTLPEKVTLIEPSPLALKRAHLHSCAYLKDESKVVCINKYLDEIDEKDISSSSPITLHFFSNILDVIGINLHKLSQLIKRNINGVHYLFCISPLNCGNNRLKAFYNYFGTPNTINEYSATKHHYGRNNVKKCTMEIIVFRLEKNEVDIRHIDYVPPMQSFAAYQLDAVKDALKGLPSEKIDGLYKHLSSFEISAPFDIKASVFSDAHPVLAVLNNIITRGLPTKASPFLERQFSKFNNRLIDDSLGSVKYAIDDLDIDELFLSLHCIDPRLDFNKENYNTKALDSVLEEDYILNKKSILIKQICTPQRSLVSITKNKNHYAQRVDFSSQFPYASQNGAIGFVLEIDSNEYHSDDDALQNDQERNNILIDNRWICKRIRKSEFNEKLGLKDDYLVNLTKASRKEYNENWIKALQLTLSPIGIARVQKTIIDALLVDKLDFNDKKWNILAIEHDVPCVVMAIAELREMFNNLASITQEFSDLKFPNANIKIISSKEFIGSHLHEYSSDGLTVELFSKATGIITNTNFDLIIDVSVLRRAELEKKDFTMFKCKSDAYFNIRTSHYVRDTRQIYTTDRIDYKPMVNKNDKGTYDIIEDNCNTLNYFLQLLFRKESFRSGQLPILSRALQNQSVIGLLPTGGGKSLTYQLAAMLQPGVTIVVDPLRSLMQDQYEGLCNNGIDTCTYINSLTKDKDARAKMMEDSQMQFVFLSPERLGIYSFREKLRNMQEVGVYFSYGVIDEVHCVSEWGHDFRFTYLHLGYNLYKYVLPKGAKKGKSITLFGLTATASFDVLADVERELSGDGVFDLDSDTIVRDENTNRLELQYKIEKVPIEYELDKNYDKNNNINPSLPKAVKMTDKWSVYKSKKNFLSSYIGNVHTHVNELQEPDNIKNITSKFCDRQNVKAEKTPHLSIEMPSNFTSENTRYNQAGIIFCPHKNKTGISVSENASQLRDDGITHVGQFMGSGDSDNSEDIDILSFENLDKFRDNKIPIMVATKAFGMGIDKPNVRFTVNMNYSSSLESFVQEAGRAGRDRRMALSTILVSDYKLRRINKKFVNTRFPLGLIVDRWFVGDDLFKIINFYNLDIDSSYIDTCTPQIDMARLHCDVCNKRFRNNLCNTVCNNCKHGPCVSACAKYNCTLRRIPDNVKEMFKYDNQWMHINDLRLLAARYKISIRNIEYQNPDYETVMYFYNNNFKGEYIEKRIMQELLSGSKTEIFHGNDAETKQTNEVSDFLNQVLKLRAEETLVAFISSSSIYSCVIDSSIEKVEIIEKNGDNRKIRLISTNKEYVVHKNELKIERDKSDISKAIYRMCCIGLIDDFTEDFKRNVYRVVAKRRENGGYYRVLQKFLERYFTHERAKLEIQKVPNYKGENEIHKCLGYLTEFIYEKIAAKRKQAIDDMRTFCMIGIDESKSWIERNEELKDYIYYYFNSKFARVGFTINNESFSLTDDTEGGKVSSYNILFKFLRVIDDNIVETNSPKDNIKHLQGAVRLIRRSVTDKSNPTLDLLNVFCLLYLKVGNNNNLKEELKNSFLEGYMGFFEHTDNKNEFYEHINSYLAVLSDNEKGIATKEELEQIEQWRAQCELKIHSAWLDDFKNKYLN